MPKIAPAANSSNVGRLTKTYVEGAGGVRVPVTMPWVLAPFGLLLLLPTPALVGSLALPGDTYPQLFQQPMFLDGRTRAVAAGYFIGLLLIAAFGLRGLRQTVFIELDGPGQVWLDRSVRALCAVTLAAYAIWFGVAVHRGLGAAVLLDLLRGSPGAMYLLRNQYFETIGGVTTWMQLGPLVVPLALLRARAGIRPARTVITLLVALSFARALLDSERLALIEIAVSLGLAMLILREAPPKIFRSTAGILGAFPAAWATLFVVFAMFEYFRSWNTQGAGYGGGFWSFAGSLLLGYYATALNLAAFDSVVSYGAHWPGHIFEGDIYASLFGASPIAGAQKAFGLETFTNRSGLLTPANAFGVVGGALVIAALGIAIVALARRTTSGGPVAFAAYCSTATGILEIVRIFYFGSSRFIPVAVAVPLLAVSWALRGAGGLRAAAPPLAKRRGGDLS